MLSSSQPLTLVVLAAGIGSRYGKAKQTDPLGERGQFLMDYSLYDAFRAGFTRICFVVNADNHHQLEARNRSVYGQPVAERLDYAVQRIDDLAHRRTGKPTSEKPWAHRTKPLGTGHALYACRHSVRTPFAIINADDWYGADSLQIMAEALYSAAYSEAPESDFCCLVCYRLVQTLSANGGVSRGICEVEDGYLTAITERHNIRQLRSGQIVYGDGDQGQFLPAQQPVSLNLWGFTPSVFEPTERYLADFMQEHGNSPDAEFYLPRIVQRLMNEQKRKVRAYSTNDAWFGMTFPNDRNLVYTALKAAEMRGVYPPDIYAAVANLLHKP